MKVVPSYAPAPVPPLTGVQLTLTLEEFEALQKVVRDENNSPWVFASKGFDSPTRKFLREFAAVVVE